MLFPRRCVCLCMPVCVWLCVWVCGCLPVCRSYFPSIVFKGVGRAHLHAGQTGLEAIPTVLHSHLILDRERGKCQRDFMPQTEELQLRVPYGQYVPTLSFQHIWKLSIPPTHADSVKMGICQKSRELTVAQDRLTRLNTRPSYPPLSGGGFKNEAAFSL